MKRLTTLALVVLALAAVPAALADGAPTQQDPTQQEPAQQQPAQQHGRVAPGIRLEILRLRMQIVQLRFRVHCSGGRNADTCRAFAQRVEDRLTKLDGNVQSKLGELQSCTSTATDGKCKNADKRIAVLTKIDEHLKKAIANVEGWLAGKATASGDDGDSSLGEAASQLAGSNG
ncbi:MAG TPA: hypothetical protein VFA56_14090 [Gaiellaceae bacterium]|nr:hypothetical protein [Gaiellaceae bacterium]